jgi:hypothetical protein
MMFQTAPLAIAVMLAVIPPSAAENLRVMTWNISGGEQSAAVLESNAHAAALQLGPVDIAIIEEVIETDQVAAIAKGLGLDHWLISDFSPPVSITGFWANSLEVAIISRIPFEHAAEWDTTGRQLAGDGFPPRASSEQVPSEEIPIVVAFGQSRPDRGFLRADLEGGWSVYGVHWKSSRGQSCNAADLINARQREDQATGLLADAKQQLENGRTLIVAGDFNIQAPGRTLRVGTNATQDCQPQGSCNGVCGAGGTDGYDDSISILLSASDHAKLLSKDLPETFVAQSFPGGAIDHIAVMGPRASAFAAATVPDVNGTSFLGSDHRPVVAMAALVSEGKEERGDKRIRPIIHEIRERLKLLEQLVGPR